MAQSGLQVIAAECSTINADDSSAARSLTAMKTLQSQTLRQLRQALIESGVIGLDEQAIALGLSRSTAWTVLQSQHKCSGIKAALLVRMLASPKLPAAARAIIVKYVHERTKGQYGHSDRLRRRFIERLERLGYSAFELH